MQCRSPNISIPQATNKPSSRTSVRFPALGARLAAQISLKPNMNQQKFTWTAQGFTSFEPHSYESQAIALSQIDPRLLRTVPFQAIAAHLGQTTEEHRLELQRRLLDRSGHEWPASILVGTLAQSDARWMRHEVSQAYTAFLRLIRLSGLTGGIDHEGKSVSGFLDYLGARDQGLRAEFLSCLGTSALNFGALGAGEPEHPVFESTPLLAECGADLMVGPQGPMFAEFNSVVGSYPHAEQRLRQAYCEVLSDFYTAYPIESSSFSVDRMRMIERAVSDFGGQCPNDRYRKIVVEAWSSQAHIGLNHRDVAGRINADYCLFDDQHKAENRYAEMAETADRMFVYNAVQLSLLEAHDPYFASIARHGFESYPELGWTGVLRDYLAGKTMLATSPLAEIGDDKAIFKYLPALTHYFLGQRMTLPVNACRPMWRLDDPSRPCPAARAAALAHRESYVVAHRYMAGGRGIFIGKGMTPERWTSLIEDHVAAKPDCFVLRDFFEMDPVYSLRVHLCALAPAGPGGTLDLLVSPDFHGRISYAEGVDNISQGGKLFLAFATPRINSWMGH